MTPAPPPDDSWCAPPRQVQVVAADDFHHGLQQWRLEAQDPRAVVQAANGVLDVQTPAGLSLWFGRAFSGDYAIRFSATALPAPASAGALAGRVSDLNMFWNATEADGSAPGPRHGALASYDTLRSHYVGFGANGNSSTRLRVYDGTGARTLLDGWADAAQAQAADRRGAMHAGTRLVAGQAVVVQIVSRTPTAADPVHLRWSANGHTLFTRSDAQPLLQGWFALRTTASHLQLSQFQVLQCSGPTGSVSPPPVPTPSASLPPASVFFQTPRYVSAQLSPSGRHLAVSAAGAQGRLVLQVLELPSLKVTTVAGYGNVDITQVRWANDERLLYQVRDLQAAAAQSRHPYPGLFSVRLDGSQRRQLVRTAARPRLLDDALELDDAADRRRLDPQVQLLHVPTARPAEVSPDEVIVGEPSVQAGGRLVAVRPLWLNVRTGLTRPLDTGGAPAAVTRWLFDARGDARLALVSDDAGRRQHHLRQGLTQAQAQSQAQSQPQGPPQAPPSAAWAPLPPQAAALPPWQALAVDTQGRLYVSSFNAGQGQVSRLDPASGQPASPPLLAVPGFDFHGQLLFDDSGATLQGLHLQADAPQQRWLDPVLAQAQALADRQFPHHHNLLQCRRCGQPDAVLLVQSSSDIDPGSLWLYSAAARRWQRVAQRLDGVDPRQMAPVAFDMAQARDGLQLPLWLTLPQAVQEGRRAPAVVLAHGGPWLRAGFLRWEAEAQFLASRGYLVIAPDFRGSRGYGPQHHRAGFKQFGAAMQDDLADALQWARDKGLADHRACIVGDSYGGYAALMGLLRHPQLYRCAVAGFAVTDLPLYVRGDWLVSDDISEHGRNEQLAQLVGHPERDAELLARQSPVNHAAALRAPLLLVSGRKDLRVPRAHTERLVDALRAAGHPPQWLEFSEEGHGLVRPEHRVQYAERMARFLAEHLGPPAPP